MSQIKTISQRVSQLSKEQTRLLVEQLNSLDGSRSTKGANQLVAFITADKTTDPLELKEYLKGQLPDFMVPSNIIQLDHFPKLPNGKIDKQALSAYYQNSRVVSEGEASGEVNELEAQLIQIWEEVLDFSPIDVNDNFFEIGGDSILSIQIVAKARKAGIALTPTLLFEHQSIVELAEQVKKMVSTDDEANAEFSGPVVLTPIQQWFFEEHQSAPHYWNQAIRVDLDVSVTPEIIENAAKQLVDTHQALRFSFTRENDAWKPEIKNTQEIQFFELQDLSQLPVDEQDDHIIHRIREIQHNTKLEKGGLFKHLFFQCNPHQPNRLVLIAHHLVIDAISWNIILDDLSEFAKDPQSQNSTTGTRSTFASWSNYLQQLASSEEILQDLPFWESQRARNKHFPIDFEVNLPVTEQTIDKLTKTNPLVPENQQGSAGIERLNLEQLLITALTLSITKWTNSPELLLGVERHGRNFSGATLDLSRSVGWFTAYYPVLLSIKDSEDPKVALKDVSNQLKKIPNSGLSYGLLRYTASNSSLDQRPPVVFNYLGKKGVNNKTVLGTIQVIEQETRHAESEREYYLEVNATLDQNKLISTWHYSKDQFKQQTIEKLAESFSYNLSILIKNATSGSDDYSTKDFPEADISQQDLDNLLDQL